MKETPKTLLLRKLGVLSSFMLCAAASQGQSNTSVFSSVSTPAHSITRLGYLVLSITGGLFLAISGLLVYAIIRYRAGPHAKRLSLRRSSAALKSSCLGRSSRCSSSSCCS